MTNLTLLNAIQTLMDNKETYIQAMKNSNQQDSIATITGLIEELTAH